MKIAVVGTANTTCGLAPFGDESWQIWTLNDMFRMAPRIDRLFQLHDPEAVRTADPEEVEWIKHTSVPVWMMHPAEWAPTFVQYPHDVIVKSFGRYFTNSVSWMIALAIHEGADEIGIWGVDMAHGSEYAAQRPSCEHIIGVAQGRGIPVFIPETSDLLHCAELYGLECSPMGANLRNRQEKLSQQLNELRNQKTMAMLNEAKTEGALEILSYVQAAWTKG